MDVVKNTFDVKKSHEDRQLDCEKIKSVVSEYYNISPAQLSSKIRTNNLIIPRHIAMYLCRELLDISLSQIGKEFGGRDHTTVINGCNKVDKLLKENEDYIVVIKEINEVDKILKVIGRYQIIEHKAPLYADKNGTLCTTLNSVYEKHTGEVAVSQSTGGGPYARALKLGVAFGPVFEGGAVCHIPNEKFKISHLEKCYFIYKDAIKELSK